MSWLLALRLLRPGQPGDLPLPRCLRLRVDPLPLADAKDGPQPPQLQDPLRVTRGRRAWKSKQQVPRRGMHRQRALGRAEESAGCMLLSQLSEEKPTFEDPSRSILGRITKFLTYFWKNTV